MLKGESARIPKQLNMTAEKAQGTVAEARRAAVAGRAAGTGENSTAALPRTAATPKTTHTTSQNKLVKWWRRTGGKSRPRYETADGARITDKEIVERIKKLAIPPAWTDVRICPNPCGKLQAIGADAAGRVQRIYHPTFSAKQQRKKYAKIERFGESLPALRRQANRDIALDGLPRERVLAVIIRLINDLYFRIGSEESVKRYKTYGVTTLRNRHLEIGRAGKLQFNFVGKHHIRHRRLVVDAELATLMRDIKSLKGSRLFNYLDEAGKVHPIRPQDVNNYIKTATGGAYSAKDFRTWGGTLLGATELAELGAPESERKAKTNLVKAVTRVAEHLGNTPAVCRSSYIHPIVLERYLAGHTLDEYVPRRTRRISRNQPDYLPEEEALLRMLKGTTKAEAEQAPKVQRAVEEAVQERDK